MESTEKLGRFGHHPDPATDFSVEVEVLEGEWLNTRIGFLNGTPTVDELRRRTERAMEFRVGGDPIAISAKAHLRRLVAELEKQMAANAAQADPRDAVIQSLQQELNAVKARYDAILAALADNRQSYVEQIGRFHETTRYVVEKLQSAIAEIKPLEPGELRSKVNRTGAVAMAVLDCPHEETEDEVVLRRDPAKPGSTASSQITRRISEAMGMAFHAQREPETVPTWVIERVRNCLLTSHIGEYAGLADHAAFEAGQDNAHATVMEILTNAKREPSDV